MVVRVLQKIDVLEAKKLIGKNKQNKNFFILDLRTPNEFNMGHLKNALNLNFYEDDFKNNLLQLKKTKTYLIYCRSGYRSGIVFDFMRKEGFKSVYDMGGIIDWVKNGFVLEK